MDKNLRELFNKAYSLGYYIEDFEKFNDALLKYHDNIESVFNHLFNLNKELDDTVKYTELETLINSYLKRIESALKSDSMYEFTSPIIRQEINDVILGLRKKYIVSGNSRNAIKEYNTKKQELEDVIEQIKELTKKTDMDSKQKGMVYLELYSTEEKIKNEIDVLKEKVEKEKTEFLNYQKSTDLFTIKNDLKIETKKIIDLIKRLPLSKNTFLQLSDIDAKFQESFIESYGKDTIDAGLDYQKLMTEFGLKRNDSLEKKEQSLLETSNEEKQDKVNKNIETKSEERLHDSLESTSNLNIHEELEKVKAQNENDIDKIIEEVENIDVPKEENDSINVVNEVLMPEEFRVIKTNKGNGEDIYLNSIIGLVESDKSLETIKRAATRAVINICKSVSRNDIVSVYENAQKLLDILENVFKSEEKVEDLEEFKSDYLELKTRLINEEPVNNLNSERSQRRL